MIKVNSLISFLLKIPALLLKYCLVSQSFTRLHLWSADAGQKEMLLSDSLERSAALISLLALSPLTETWHTHANRQTHMEWEHTQKGVETIYRHTLTACLNVHWHTVLHQGILFTWMRVERSDYLSPFIERAGRLGESHHMTFCYEHKHVKHM